MKQRSLTPHLDCAPEHMYECGKGISSMATDSMSSVSATRDRTRTKEDSRHVLDFIVNSERISNRNPRYAACRIIQLYETNRFVWNT